MNHSTAVNRLILGDGREVKLDFPIRATAEAGDAIIVLLEVPGSVYMPRNVFAVSPGGEVLWQIPELRQLGTTPANRFTGILSCDAERVRLYNYNGFAVEADAADGSIVSYSFVK